jgi:transcriptional regulator with XRE-family HTH domain
MIIGKKVSEALKRGHFVKARTSLSLSAGESLRLCRELQELTQSQVAARTGIPQSTLSGMESGRIGIGVERAKVLARALGVHPAVLLFSNWDSDSQNAA